MKTTKYLLFVLLFFVEIYTPAFSQSCYHPFVDSVISGVSLLNLCLYNRQLSGDTTAVIGSQTYRIISRYRLAPGNDIAASYIYDKFTSFGLDTRYMVYSSTGKNVIGKKLGAKYPNQQILISAHYDNIINAYQQPDTIPGADDNASGVSVVLEAARVLNMYNWDYTLIFVTFDEEEAYAGGSIAYSDSALVRGDSIICVFNADMVAWHSNNDYVFDVRTNPLSESFADLITSAAFTYTQLSPCKRVYSSGAGSDEGAFWRKGFKAVTSIEDKTNWNNHYHYQLDKFQYLNLPYFQQITQSVIAAVIVAQKNYIINYVHTPFRNDSSTASKIAVITINSDNGIAGGSNSPKLYYRSGNNPYTPVEYFYHNLDTFKFVIPGHTTGSTVSYYFAAQDSSGNITSTYPFGGRGINPPGAIPPEHPFRYIVMDLQSACSNTVPKNIMTLQSTYDTIVINDSHLIIDINVNLNINFPLDTMLIIQLINPEGKMITLSTRNGGSGANYTNTTFDDSASIFIKDGGAPFTGAFIPEAPLDACQGMPFAGAWKLRVLNLSGNLTGQIVNWCLYASLYNPIGITKNQVPVGTSLSQNYPNPFNPATTIRFTLERASDVKLVVYDVLGREVGRIINGKMHTGEYNMRFDGSNLSSGLYFYTLYIDGIRYDTKKMVLIK